MSTAANHVVLVAEFDINQALNENQTNLAVYAKLLKEFSENIEAMIASGGVPANANVYVSGQLSLDELAWWNDRPHRTHHVRHRSEGEYLEELSSPYQCVIERRVKTGVRLLCPVRFSNVPAAEDDDQAAFDQDDVLSICFDFACSNPGVPLDLGEILRQGKILLFATKTAKQFLS
jgi:hypothetical protein